MALGFYNPLQRLLDGPLNVSGQPERTPEGLINRPSPVYDFASVMGENTVPKMPAEMYLRGGIGGIGGGQFSAPAEPNTPEFNALKAKRAELQEQMKTIPIGIRGGTNEFGQNPRPAITAFGPKYNPTQQETDDLARYKSILSQQNEIDSQISSMMPNQGLGVQLDGSAPAPYAASVDQVTRGLDPVTQQLLFGLDGEGGFIPGAMRAAERTFFDDQGNPVVIPEQVADLTQDQLDAFQLARSGIGSEGRFLTDAEAQYRKGLAEQQNYLKDALSQYRSGVDTQGSFLGDAEAAYRSGIGSLMGGLERGLGVTEGATERFRDDLSGVEDLMRETTRGYDPSMTEQFYNPYEDRVVQQTISDVMDAGDRADIAQTARNIATGGESAFGSRARLNAAERREALGRGLGEALGGIRSRGFTEAQRTGLGEFGRQLASERSAASGLAGLARSGYGADTQLGNLYGNIGQQQMLGQSRLGSALSGLGQQRMGGLTGLFGALSGAGQQTASAYGGLGGALSGLGRQGQTQRFGDIQALLGGGNLQQQQAQQQLQASRANALQAQTAPLLQYQSLLPFIQTVPTGAMQTNIGFQPTPSPLQAGLGVGLSALGALGNFMNPNPYYSQSNP